MIYKIFRVLMRMALKFYFKKIEIKGLENIPHSAPVIFACNHPSAFMEAVLLACFQPRTLHFLVRGDVFKIPWLRGLLRITNQIPIYRFKDGFSNLKQNKNTFAKANQILHEGGAIIIYPEGSTILTKKLRTLKKGVSRLALTTLDTYDSDELFVVPVGINYFNVMAWRSDVSIQIGKPIDTTEYRTLSKQKHPEALQVLTERIYQGLQPLVISLENYRLGHDWLLATAISEARRTNRASGIFLPQMDKAMEINSMPGTDIPTMSLSHAQYRRMVSPLSKGLAIVGSILFGILALPAMVIFVPLWKFSGDLLRRKRLDEEFLAPTRLSIFLILITFLLLISASILTIWMGLAGVVWIPAMLISFWSLSRAKDYWDVWSPVHVADDKNNKI